MNARPEAGRLQRLDVKGLIGVVKAATAITSQLEAVLRESTLEIRANDFDALVFLVGEGPMRPAELLKYTALTDKPATLHAILARLEASGFVERATHPEHKRGVLYGATPAGEAAIETVWSTVERRVIHRFAGHFSAEELVQLVDLTRRI